MYIMSIPATRAAVIHMIMDISILLTHVAQVTGIMIGTVLMMAPDVMVMLRIIAAKRKVAADID